MKSERMAKRTSFGNIVLKKLSDITNLQNVKVGSHEEKPPEMSETEKSYVDQLLKERRNLMKLITERNQIIELGGTELQSLRVSLQKLQLQNWNLAQSNSQMLAEINLGRERVKALQHDLMCKNALLKAKSFRQEGKTKGEFQKTCLQEREEATMDLDGYIDDTEKPRNHHRMRTIRSQSMGHSTSQKADDNEKLENKRRGLKRQSARFKSHEREPIDNLFEIEYANNECRNDPFREEEFGASKRASVGRPSRRAAVKVQSYKEKPLNVKMRREE